MIPDQQRRVAEAFNNQGLAAARAQRCEDAATCFRDAIRAFPDDAKYYANLGAMLNRLDQTQEAVEQYRAALERDPNFAAAYHNLGGALGRLGEIPDAIAAYRQAVALQPDNVVARAQISAYAFSHGDIATATAAMRDAIARAPDHREYWRALTHLSLYDADMTPAARFALHRQVNAAFPATPEPIWPNPPLGAPPRPLRVGLLSSDLHQHPVGKNYGPILAGLDPAQFELWAYRLRAVDDAVSAEMRRLCRGWTLVQGLSEEAIAARIRADAIDILLITAGHFDDNRPLAAQFRPAPVVISIGDNGLGLDGIHYFLSDALVSPRPWRDVTVERPVRLPNFYVHAPPTTTPPPPVPAAQRFIAPHNPRKLNDVALRLWGDILRAAPQATLTFRYLNQFLNPSLQRRVRALLGADVADRAQFRGPAEPGAHFLDLAQHRVTLDPFPFTGATATFESLWMGVPVVAMRGATWHERMSSAILTRAGLGALIAEDADAYLALAVDLVQDRPRLEPMRQETRARLAASPICDPHQTPRWFGRLLRALWRRFDAGRAGEAP